MALNTSFASKSDYDRISQLRSFEETKTGVKGLVDSGITEIPQIFRLHSTENYNSETPQLLLPTIDLEGIDEDPIRRKEVIEKVKDALESWGLFQMVNHGIPTSVLEEMLKGIKDFHEQGPEMKKKWYTRDLNNRNTKVMYTSNYDLYIGNVATWRDTLYGVMAPNPPEPHELPTPCRDIWPKYSSEMVKLGECVFKLISEALGLDPNHLFDMGCAEGLHSASNYYPPCPQPELTIGLAGHTDNSFITILLQDDIGGLQVFYKNQWTNVTPIPGALAVNAGDLLQLITNDKFISAKHRVLAKKIGPRVSVASFFSTGHYPSLKMFEPIKELLSKDNQAKYKGITVKEFNDYFIGRGLDSSALLHFKI